MLCILWWNDCDLSLIAYCWDGLWKIKVLSLWCGLDVVFYNWFWYTKQIFYYLYESNAHFNIWAITLMDCYSFLRFRVIELTQRAITLNIKKNNTILRFNN
jgi:hypothetical protein